MSQSGEKGRSARSQCARKQRVEGSLCERRLVKTQGADRTAVVAIVRRFVFLPEQAGRVALEVSE